MSHPEVPEPYSKQPEAHESPDINAELAYVPFALSTRGDVIELDERYEPLLSKTEEALQASQALLTTLKKQHQEMAILGTDGYVWNLRSDGEHDTLDMREHPTGSWTVTSPDFIAEITRREADYPGGPKHSVVVTATESGADQLIDPPSEEHIAAAILYAQTKVTEQDGQAQATRQRAGFRLGRLLGRSS